MGVVVSSSRCFCTPSSSGAGLLTCFLCSSMGSLPRETMLHELFQCQSFPWATVPHELLQPGCLTGSAVLQEQCAPVWVPCSVTSPASKPAPAWAPLSRVHRSCQEPAPTLASCCGVTASLGHSAALAWDPSWISVPHWTSMDCRGISGISALVSGTCPASPSALILGSAKLLFAHILTHISQLLLLSFCPLKYAIPH